MEKMKKAIILNSNYLESAGFFRLVQKAIQGNGYEVIGLNEGSLVLQICHKDPRKPRTVVYFSASLLREAEGMAAALEDLRVFLFPSQEGLASDEVTILPETNEGVNRLLQLITDDPNDCEICHRPIGDTIVILPIKRDGRLETIACMDCAMISSAYCKQHQAPHMGFKDDSTACVHCIHGLVEQNKTWAAEIMQSLVSALPSEEIDVLREYAMVGSRLTDRKQDICVLTAIVSRAVRAEMYINEVVKKVIEDRSVAFLDLPTD
jgi:hypothetical protein